MHVVAVCERLGTDLGRQLTVGMDTDRAEIGAHRRLESVARLPGDRCASTRSTTNPRFGRIVEGPTQWSGGCRPSDLRDGGASDGVVSRSRRAPSRVGGCGSGNPRRSVAVLAQCVDTGVGGGEVAHDSVGDSISLAFVWVIDRADLELGLCHGRSRPSGRPRLDHVGRLPGEARCGVISRIVIYGLTFRPHADPSRYRRVTIGGPIIVSADGEDNLIGPRGVSKVNR